jgi:hypothetical protein
MPLSNETELRRPLADTEIIEGTAVKVAQAAYDAIFDAVVARMKASGGRLYGTAYPSFKCSGNLHLEYFLDWRGEQTPRDDQREKVIDNHAFTVDVNGDLQNGGEPAEVVEVPVVIPETPPNVFRKETGQPIPVASNQGGKITEKRVKYQPRRK